MLLLLTIIVLLLPKLLGATLAVTNRTLRRGFGGVRGLVPSLLIEQVFSMLLAPMMMVYHSVFVVRTLIGTTVSWDAQARGDRGLTYGAALRRHALHVVLGLVWARSSRACSALHLVDHAGAGGPALLGIPGRLDERTDARSAAAPVGLTHDTRGNRHAEGAAAVHGAPPLVD